MLIHNDPQLLGSQRTNSMDLWQLATVPAQPQGAKNLKQLESSTLNEAYDP